MFFWHTIVQTLREGVFPLKTTVVKTKLAHLFPAQRDFLTGMMALPAKKPHEKIAIYLRSGETFAHVEDAYIFLEHNRRFRTDAPDGLWLTGAVGNTKVMHAGKRYSLAVYDERTKGVKPCPAGWSSEGDLMDAARRETSEEIIIFSLDRKKQYVPKGIPASRRVDALGISSIESVEEIKEITPLRYNIRDDKTIEIIFEFDLTALRLRDEEGKNLISIAYDDEWFQGGYFGSPVLLLNEHGRVCGGFFGQQGLCMFDEVKLEPMFVNHPDLLKT